MPLLSPSFISVRYQMENGATYVAAYPVEPDSPDHRFLGLKTNFEKADFEFVKKADKRRNVMLHGLITNS